MDACLRGPDIEGETRQVRQLLASVRYGEGPRPGDRPRCVGTSLVRSARACGDGRGRGRWWDWIPRRVMAAVGRRRRRRILRGGMSAESAGVRIAASSGRRPRHCLDERNLAMNLADQLVARDRLDRRPRQRLARVLRPGALPAPDRGARGYLPRRAASPTWPASRHAASSSAAAVAADLGCGFVAIRKDGGLLPGPKHTGTTLAGLPRRRDPLRLPSGDAVARGRHRPAGRRLVRDRQPGAHRPSR